MWPAAAGSRIIKEIADDTGPDAGNQGDSSPKIQLNNWMPTKQQKSVATLCASPRAEHGSQSGTECLAMDIEKAVKLIVAGKADWTPASQSDAVTGTKTDIQGKCHVNSTP